MRHPHVLLVLPPLTQLNTPYPSTAYLTGWLRSQGRSCSQADLGLELVLRLYSRDGLRAVFEAVRLGSAPLPVEARAMLRAEAKYLEQVDRVVAFLQGRASKLARSLLAPGGLPRGPRFRGRTRFRRSIPVSDRAKQWATFFVEDLADLIQAGVSPYFGLSRYAEHLARSASSFDSLQTALSEPPTLPDRLMLEALHEELARTTPDLVGLSVPFPGNLYGAFRIAQEIKRIRPETMVALGGGYVNTELRRLADPRIFDYVDFVTVDDGERPLLSLVEHLDGQRPRDRLCRTFYREGDRVRFADDPSVRPVSMADIACPTYDGLRLDDYLTILDSTNPMHRLWSEGHWNKLTVAHGCYWRQCTFCDVGLDYIGRYEVTPTERLLAHIERLIKETGRREFHFVDEAAPPAALKALALALLERDLRIRWWGNIRFEEAFTPDLCRLLAASGCIAVTAGLEAASDRLLDMMKKGITVDQTAMVAAAFRKAGILVHAYLMYGFPSETIQETVDSLERVRQLFAADLLQSAFWHRFTATAHSPIGLAPKANGIRILGPKFQGFAENDLVHEDRRSRTPEWLGAGLRRSMLNFLEGRGLTMDVRDWFEHRVPRPRVAPAWARTVLATRVSVDDATRERRLVWIGNKPAKSAGLRTSLQAGERKTSRGALSKMTAEWLSEVLRQATPGSSSGAYPRVHELAASYPEGSEAFARLLATPAWRRLRANGLLLV